MYINIGDFIVRKELITVVERSVEEQVVIVVLADGTHLMIEDVDGSVWNFLNIVLLESTAEGYLDSGLY